MTPEQQEKLREYNRLYYQNHIKRIREGLPSLNVLSDSERAEKNLLRKEKEKETRRRWYTNNKERILSYQKSYKKEHYDRTKDKEKVRVKGAIKRARNDYGLPYEDYLKLKKLPCGICGETRLEERNMHIDHTIAGSYHDVLCSLCNQGIGLLRHDPEIILKAAAYVLKTRTTLTTLRTVDDVDALDLVS